MITILAKLLIPKNKSEAETRLSYGILSGGVGIFLNLCLFVGKFIAGSISTSIAITADAFNNLSDAASSIITLLGFRLGAQKPDADHPFGHGRFEYVSGFLVSVIILMMGFELCKSSVEKIIHPEEIVFSMLVVGILLASIAVKFYMYFYNRNLGRKLNSAAMEATATDSLSDMVATTAVLFSTLLSRLYGIQADGWFGLFVGLFVCYAGLSAAKDTISPLLGQAPDADFVEQVEQIVTAHEPILGVHDLIVHNYGPERTLISLHAEVPADGELMVLHDLIDNIEHELKDKLGCHAVIHMDPVLVGDVETEKYKAIVKGYLKEISDELSMHDFRVVAGPTHTNLIFDVAVPFDFPLSDSELMREINCRVNQEHPNYKTVIEVDRA